MKSLEDIRSYISDQTTFTITIERIRSSDQMDGGNPYIAFDKNDRTGFYRFLIIDSTYRLIVNDKISKIFKDCFSDVHYSVVYGMYYLNLTPEQKLEFQMLYFS